MRIQPLTSLIIEPTNTCNLRCTFCFVTDGMTREEGFMDLKLFKKIIDETQDSVSFYPSVKIINETHSIDEKKELLSVLWKLVTADSVIDAYEENLYFKIAELIKIKRSIANQIKQENS